MAYTNKPKWSPRCPKLFHGPTKMFLNRFIDKKRHGRWCIYHLWHCIILVTKLASSTLSRCWLEIIRAATNKPKHHNICTSTPTTTPTSTPTKLQCHHHRCSASAPPRARAQLGCDYRQSFVLVSPWSHSHHQREDHNLGSCFLLLLLLQSRVRSVSWDHVLLLLLSTR